jgi:hypothetical protein
MRLQLICTLFVGTVIATLYGQEVSLYCPRLYSMLISLTVILQYKHV